MSEVIAYIPDDEPDNMPDINRILRTRQDIADSLKSELEKSKLKVYEFRESLELDMPSWYSWIRAKQNMTTAVFFRIADVLGYQIILKKKGSK